MVYTFIDRIKMLLYRAWFYFTQIPIRLFRCMRHLILIYKVIFLPELMPVHYHKNIVSRILIWIVESLFYLTDLFGIPEILETMWNLIHHHYKPLTATDKAKLDLVFEGQMNLNLIKQGRPLKLFSNHLIAAYVTFNTINFIFNKNDKLLIHEACHCWQYQKVGSVYILRALLAQNMPAGYDYRFDIRADHLTLTKMDLLKLNYEQQAEIITDFYLLKNGLHGQYSFQSDENLEILNTYASKLLSKPV